MTRPIPEGVVPPEACYPEVARLNTNPNQISTSAVDPKEALIRELVGALQGIRSTSTDGLSFALYSATVRDQCKKALTLARTTCPEAFEK